VDGFARGDPVSEIIEENEKPHGDVLSLPTVGKTEDPVDGVERILIEHAVGIKEVYRCFPSVVLVP